MNDFRHRSNTPIKSLLGVFLWFYAASLFAAAPMASLLEENSQAKPATKYEYQPFLYRVSHLDLHAGSYIFGTIHLPDQRVLALPTVVETVLDEVDAVFMEIDLSKGQAAIMQAMYLTDGETLSEILPAELHKKLSDYFVSKGFRLEPFENMRVWAVMSMVALLDHIGEMALPLDHTIFNNAAFAGKEVGGLETAEEQLAIFQSFTREEHITILEMTLDDLIEATDNPVEEMIMAYLAGDPEALQEVINLYTDLEDPLINRFMDTALTQRDRRLANRMDEQMKTHPGKSFFFGVGAAHLIEETSVLHHLKEKGYTIERLLNNAPAQTSNEIQELIEVVE